eukprot:jgi/Chlat1/7546/Chrsp62S07035
MAPALSMNGGPPHSNKRAYQQEDGEEEQEEEDEHESIVGAARLAQKGAKFARWHGQFGQTLDQQQQQQQAGLQVNGGGAHSHHSLANGVDGYNQQPGHIDAEAQAAAVAHHHHLSPQEGDGKQPIPSNWGLYRDMNELLHQMHLERMRRGVSHNHS